MAKAKPNNDWGKRGRARFTRLSMLKRDIRAADTRARKKGIKPDAAGGR